MPAGPEQRLSPEERANLTAYIDGELTESEARSMSTKLALSGTARRELESLKKTWELLEHLPRPPASVDFPGRTLDSVRAIDAKSISLDRNAGFWMAQAGKFGLCLVVAATALGAGFALTRWAVPDPTARQAQELSVAEHLEEYQEAGSFDFLEELVKSKEFGRPTP